MDNVLGLIMSFVAVFAVMFASEMLLKVLNLPKEESRKFVHIGVSHWWLLAMFAFSSWRWAIIPPIFFILLNLISWYTGLFSSMERKPRDPANLGTVYFPIALLIMVVLTWQDSPILENVHPFLGGLGIMAMGYGDGFAALVGSNLGKHKFTFLGSTRSLEGSLAMFVAALFPLFFLISSFALPALPALAAAAMLSLLATIIEAITPWGLDNLTVPFAVITAAYFILF